MSDLQAARDKVEALMDEILADLDDRVESLRRISTPEEEATEVASAEATAEAQSYIDSVIG